MAIEQLVRFELEHVNNDYDDNYDPIIMALFVNQSGDVLNTVETFGYWGRSKSEVWPFRVLAGGDPFKVKVDFGCSEGDDVDFRFGVTNIRSIRISEGEFAHFTWAGDTWNVRVKRIVNAVDGTIFRAV